MATGTGEIHGEARGRARNARKDLRCGARTIRNGICTARGTMPDGRCPFHTDTMTAAQKQAWRKRGLESAMQHRRPVSFLPADLTSAETARALVEETINLARAGKIPTSTANAVSKLVAVGLKTQELKLVEQIQAIQARLDGPAKRRRTS